MIRLSEPKSKEEFREQLFKASYFVIFLFLVLLSRVWFLQIVEGEKWRQFSEANRIKLKEIPAMRGRILDRNQQVIAASRPLFQLQLLRSKAEQPLEILVDQLQKLISIDKSVDDIKRESQKINPHHPYVIKEDLSEDEVAIMLSKQVLFPGLHVEVVPVRDYIDHEINGHLLGYIGEIGKKQLERKKLQEDFFYELGDTLGVSGIEKSFEEILRGVDGARPVVEDVWGRELGVELSSDLLPGFSPRPAQDGKDLVLTIDKDLQNFSQKLIQDKAFSIVALDPRNGDILAMISQPGFHPEDFVNGIDPKLWKTLANDPQKPLFNRSIQGLYPPASTFKAFTALAILEEGVTNPDEKVFCPGYYRIGREVKRCWQHAGHGWMNLVGALKNSCDTYFYEMSLRLGIDKLSHYVEQFGLGHKTGISLSDEAAGLVPDKKWKLRSYNETWVDGETASVAIGQGALQTTPLQMAVAYAALINGGQIIEPRLALRALDQQDQIVQEFDVKPLSTVSISESSLQPVLKGLKAVVNEPGGTGYWFARSNKIDIAGKTGTAQVVGRKSGLKIENHAWFLGYAPIEDPEIVVSVIVEYGGNGSSGAGPIAKKVIEKYFELKDERIF
ncbi:MAG: penicillin-binding protein 2 [Bdellovibrionales bacterium]|nr:penicillin-binding protein 2 [Bdellovibrionales bacterium]